MGTIGGNAANGDPGNDMPALMMTLDAAYALQSAKGERRVKARAFYRGVYDTAAAARRNPRRDPIPDAPPRVMARPTKSSSARSGTMQPPPPPSC